MELHVDEYRPPLEIDIHLLPSRSRDPLDAAVAARGAGQPTSATSTKQSPARVESLPPELRHYLLTLLGFDELRGLVHASPVYHQQYLAARQSLLRQLLEAILGSAASHAYAAYRATSERASGRLTWESIRGHIERYKERRSSSDNFALSEEDLAEDDLAAMTRFDRLFVVPLVQLFARYEYERYPKLQQSLYVFQFCCSLFGAGRLGSPEVVDQEPEEILEQLNEVQDWGSLFQIDMVYVFARDKYAQVFRYIGWDVERPRYSHRDLRPLLLIAISRGLELLSSVIEIDNRKQLRLTMEEQLASPESIACPTGWFLQCCLAARRLPRGHLGRRGGLHSGPPRRSRTDVYKSGGERQARNELGGAAVRTLQRRAYPFVDVRSQGGGQLFEIAW